MAEQQNILTMPALALRGLVVYPRMMVHFDVGREMSIKALEEAMSNNQPVFLVAQKDIRVEAPGKSHLYTMGTVAVVKQLIHLPVSSSSARSALFSTIILSFPEPRPSMSGFLVE